MSRIDDELEQAVRDAEAAPAAKKPSASSAHTGGDEASPVVADAHERKGWGLLAVLLVLAGVVLTLVFTGGQEAVVYSHSVDEVKANAAEFGNKPLRVQGSLVAGSLVRRDNPCEYRFMMRKLLEMEGYRVVEARNGEEAVKVAQAENPALILMDLSLPIIDGLAATRLIRKLPALEKTPIIVVSAHDTADFQARALKAGCDRYITKPIDFERLEELIAELLGE